MRVCLLLCCCPDHPEHPDRVRVLNERLAQAGLLDRCIKLPAKLVRALHALLPPVVLLLQLKSRCQCKQLSDGPITAVLVVMDGTRLPA
jgi:hypothetical protein